ncbi:hypothetical protein [Peptococcus niger]|nr:hypothetical protein [Peptococcus niger]
MTRRIMVSPLAVCFLCQLAAGKIQQSLVRVPVVKNNTFKGLMVNLSH